MDFGGGSLIQSHNHRCPQITTHRDSRKKRGKETERAETGIMWSQGEEQLRLSKARRSMTWAKEHSYANACASPGAYTPAVLGRQMW